ncbi:hypothetical protein BDQ12DRAFT_727171 [Crucibulum laeve]|uniref:BTB domain-containing protein n=1 Tax=Crucibulum laeve TaxID=68775 RepID=A0A5C3LMM7_9AGAR|nr:hypothetical protein BDQ12DRAFT_727171 [Crucibulum laeve]
MNNLRITFDNQTEDPNVGGTVTVDRLPKCHIEGCTLDVDISFSEGLPPTNFVDSRVEMVVMPDLDLVSLPLFIQFMHHCDRPEPLVIKFSAFWKLAEAVEKYHVYSARQVCMIHMKEHILDHPLEVLLYAVKHGYPKLSDTAAIVTIENEGEWVSQAESAFANFPDVLLAWYRYQGKYKRHYADIAHHAYRSPDFVLHKGGKK